MQKGTRTPLFIATLLWIGWALPLNGQSTGPIHDSPQRPTFELTPRGPAQEVSTPEYRPGNTQIFKARQVGEQVELRWQAAAGQSAAYIAIEHSTDGKTFRDIGRIPGNGNLAQQQIGEFTDNRARPGTNYYRLRRVNTLGRAEYSPVQTVVTIISKPTNIQLYPELSVREMTLPMAAGEVIIYNGMGQHIARTQLQDDGATISVTHLPQGQYWLAVRTFSGTVQTGSFVKG